MLFLSGLQLRAARLVECSRRVRKTRGYGFVLCGCIGATCANICIMYSLRQQQQQPESTMKFHSVENASANSMFVC